MSYIPEKDIFLTWLKQVLWFLGRLSYLVSCVDKISVCDDCDKSITQVPAEA